ncbi:sigma-70 region 4 domain-containing protein [Pusillimonas sp. CC-YST705]|uniref:Sigma-70 region 4 domain-containing protein n=1 Tax=Mesopusillimonas faecipullorum TaxID=2755040 RepID=A0ABS8C8Q8_9BURK|nr:sigma-70 region 4 domain-containing protein [Mesopusillimonas faecipullorum]MCB5362410.1 sigma-70 region 4 domain-containing protein [Mesopusillimonas faecipullorum]
MEELPERQRETFVLHRFDGLVYEEIAARMHISRALVNKLISQAMAYCRLLVNYPQAEYTVTAQKDADHEA